MNPGGSYWCHRCTSRVSLQEGTDPVCPTCTEGFLEQLGGGDPGIHSLPSALLLASYLAGNNGDAIRSGALRGQGDGLRRRWHNRPTVYPNPSYGGGGAGRPSTLQLLELMTFLSAPSRRVVESRRDEEDSMFPRFLSRRVNLNEDVDSYAREFATGLEALIQHVGERDGGHHGSAPASKSAVDAMPVVKFKKENSQADDIHCAVCKEAFETDGEVREMPCKHIYHSDCILPWLARHRSCPICRHELPAEESLPREPQGEAESSNSSWPPRGQIEDNEGEFGLAIVGDLGFGIHVRSVTLWGLGGSHQDDGMHENNVEVLDSTSEGGSRPSTSSISSIENVASRRASQRDVSELAPDTTSTCTMDLGSQTIISTPATADLDSQTIISTPATANLGSQTIISTPGTAVSATSGSSSITQLHKNSRWGHRLRNWISRHSCSSISSTATGRHLHASSNRRARRVWWW